MLIVLGFVVLFVVVLCKIYYDNTSNKTASKPKAAKITKNA